MTAPPDLDTDTEPKFTPTQLGRMTAEQVAGIEARIRHATLPFWQRWRTSRPPTWAQTTKKVA